MPSTPLTPILERYAARMDRAIVAAIRDLDGFLAEAILSQADWTYADVDGLVGQLEAALRESGFDDVAENLNEAMRAYAQKIDATYTRVNFGRHDAVQLRSALEAKFGGWYDAVRPRLAQWLRERMAASVLAPVDRRSLVTEMREYLTGKFKASAGTYAETALHDLERATWRQAGENAGADTWTYTGPDDALTRPECEELLRRVADGETWTTAEVDQYLQTFDPGGALGYNCRHTFVPVL